MLRQVRDELVALRATSNALMGQVESDLDDQLEALQTALARCELPRESAAKAGREMRKALKREHRKISALMAKAPTTLDGLLEIDQPDPASPTTNAVSASLRTELAVENERATILIGRDALRDLKEMYGSSVVYVGTMDRHPVLVPTVKQWIHAHSGRRYRDGDPAICADVDFEVPIFMALFPGRRRCAYFPDGAGKINYRVGPAITSDAEDIANLEGYVHVVERENFELFSSGPPDGWPEQLPHGRPPEMRARVSVTPLFIVKVKIDDFRLPIEFDDSFWSGRSE